jgi:hypothetical protein
MTAAVPFLGLFNFHKPQIRLVNERRRLQRLSGFFVSELLGRQLAQVLKDERQQLRRGLRITGLDRLQDSRHLVHKHQSNNALVEHQDPLPQVQGMMTAKPAVAPTLLGVLTIASPFGFRTSAV